MPNDPPRYCILAVDDDEAALYATAKALRDGGFEVFTARNYFDALDVLDRPETAIDVLLTDVVLNLGNGFALARIARLHRPSLKAVYITGFDDVPTVEAVGPVLRKPISDAELVDAIRGVLADGRAGAA
jgi:DNA-binding NtrC family response regulator